MYILLHRIRLLLIEFIVARAGVSVAVADLQ